MFKVDPRTVKNQHIYVGRRPLSAAESEGLTLCRWLLYIRSFIFDFYGFGFSLIPDNL